MKYSAIWILFFFYFSTLFNISAQNNEDGWDKYWDQNQEFIDLLMAGYPANFEYLGISDNKGVTIVMLLDKSSISLIGKLYELNLYHWRMLKDNEKIEPVDISQIGILCDCNNNKVKIAFVIDPITDKSIAGQDDWLYSYSSGYAKRIISKVCK